MRTRVLNHFHTFYPEAQAEHDRLALEEKRLTIAKARQGEDDGQPARRRMSEQPEDLDAQLADVRARIEEQKAIIASGVVRLHLSGLGRKVFRRIITEHPPREGEALDAQLGYNADTFGEALVRACLIRTDSLDGDPVPNEWDKWADEMTDGQWEEVFTAALKLQTDGNPSVFPR
jgi:hypothetical protein